MNQTRQILIIEDELIIAKDIESILMHLGYGVEKIIQNGDEAISYLSFHSPDLVLCDISIKGQSDGIEVATRISKKKKIPFVFLTSLSDPATLDRAKLALPFGYIVKPFDERDIASAVEIALFKFEQELQAVRISRDRIEKLAERTLTDQEYHILEHMIKGADYKFIAESLTISRNTIKYHTKNIFLKFEASGRADLMQKLLMLYASVDD